RRGLVIYGLLLVISGWAAGVLLDDWVEREPELYQRDRLATVWLQLGAEEVSPWTEALAWLGDVRVLAGVAAFTAVSLRRRGRRQHSVLTVVNFAGALALGWGLQLWLKRPLPPAPEPIWQLTAYAFPHLSSLLAVAVYGWLAHLRQQEHAWSGRVNGATTAIFLSAGVGIIGLYLEQANLSDVLAGLSLGFLWLGIPVWASNERVKQVGHQVKVKAELMTPRRRLHLLLALTLPVLVLTFIEPPIAQDPSYHHFADQRLVWGIPNFFNVTSNVPFLLFGLMGLIFLWRLRRTGGWPAFVALVEERPYLVFFIGIAAAGFGSAYYHLAPDNTHLVWDRLPMTFDFMSLFAAVIVERIDRDTGLRLLWPLVGMGISSVVYWYWSELHLHGDLRFYADVQFYPLMAIPLITALFPSRYTKGEQLYTIILIYALAKAFELLDKPVYQLLEGVISGHTIKHLVAALATYWALRMLLLRRPLTQSAHL
ncbi:MAG: ceramidase domain-containing protein, partial [Anaerolineae bacterium]